MLIVEDDPIMQRLYSIFFSEYRDKFKLDIYTNAVYALEASQLNDYDLVILDLIMEPMSGNSFLINFRAMEKNGNVPVIIVSVLSPDDFKALTELGKMAFLQKPITEELLFQKIQNFFPEKLLQHRKEG